MANAGGKGMTVMPGALLGHGGAARAIGKEHVHTLFPETARQPHLAAIRGERPAIPGTLPILMAFGFKRRSAARPQ